MKKTIKKTETVKKSANNTGKKTLTDTSYDRWSDGGGAVRPPIKKK